jgi:hypothetical protein
MRNKEEVSKIGRAIWYMEQEFMSFNNKRKEVGVHLLSKIKSYPDEMSFVELINAMAYILITFK